MRGSPRSLWLSMANRAAGWWTSAAVARRPTATARYAGGIPQNGDREKAEAEIPGSADLAKLRSACLARSLAAAMRSSFAAMEKWLARGRHGQTLTLHELLSPRLRGSFLASGHS